MYVPIILITLRVIRTLQVNIIGKVISPVVRVMQPAHRHTTYITLGKPIVNDVVSSLVPSIATELLQVRPNTTIHV